MVCIYWVRVRVRVPECVECQIFSSLGVVLDHLGHLGDRVGEEGWDVVLSSADCSDENLVVLVWEEEGELVDYHFTDMLYVIIVSSVEVVEDGRR